MKEKIYEVIRRDDNMRGFNTYYTFSPDAIEAAKAFGRGETGEVIRVYDDNGRIVSAVYWDSRYRKYRRFNA